MKQVGVVVGCVVALFLPLNAQIEAFGDYTIVNEDKNFYITDRSQPQQPVMTSVYTADSKIQSMAVRDDVAYLETLGSKGFSIIDLNNKYSPEKVGRYDDGSYSKPLKIKGNFLYTQRWTDADNITQLQILDISNKSNPVLVNTLDLGEDIFVREIEISGNHAFILVDNVVKILNTGLVTINQIATIDLQTTFDELIESISVSGDYLYLATYKGFRIYNIANIQNPTLAGNYIEEADVFPAENVKLVVEGDYAYYGFSHQVSSVSIKDKTAPSFVNSNTINNIVQDITIGGNYMYIDNYSRVNDNITEWEEVVVLDITDGAAPSELKVQNIAAFVRRFYHTALYRVADDIGLAIWTKSLSEQATGEDIAKGFILSGEFIASNSAISDREFLDKLYWILLGREATKKDLDAWLDKMNNGASREDVLNGFIYSKEFANFAQSYGVIPTKSEIIIEPDPYIEAFVERFYNEILDRSADEAGLRDWTQKLTSGKSTASDIAKGFIFSKEFKNRELSDDDFITTLYRSFFDREPDSGGKAYWLKILSGDLSKRAEVLEGFLLSPEFVDLADKYNISIARYNNYR